MLLCGAQNEITPAIKCITMFYNVSYVRSNNGHSAKYTVFDGCDWRHSHTISYDINCSPYRVTANEIITFYADDNGIEFESCGADRSPITLYTGKNADISGHNIHRVRGTDLLCSSTVKTSKVWPSVTFINTVMNKAFPQIILPKKLSIGYAQPFGNCRMYIADRYDIAIDPLITSYKCTNVDESTIKTEGRNPLGWAGSIGENTIYMYWIEDGLLEMRDIRMRDPCTISKLRTFQGRPIFLQSGHIVCYDDCDSIVLVDLRMPSESYDLPCNPSYPNWLTFTDIID